LKTFLRWFLRATHRLWDRNGTALAVERVIATVGSGHFEDGADHMAPENRSARRLGDRRRRSWPSCCRREFEADVADHPVPLRLVGAEALLLTLWASWNPSRGTASVTFIVTVELGRIEPWPSTGRSSRPDRRCSTRKLRASTFHSAWPVAQGALARPTIV
jgi:hypothetical protein